MPKTLKFAALALLAAAALPACGNGGKTIVVGASSTPHALILEAARPAIESSGWKLEVRVFDDYVLPNLALENGELDANYFQHKPYLEEFNAANGTRLSPVMDVHFEPMGVYAGRKSSLSEAKAGDKVAIPSDKSNSDRAKALLESLGLECEEIEMEAKSIPLALADCDFACINGSYALASGVVGRCLATESKDSETAKRLANVIAVKAGAEDSDKTKALVSALEGEAVAEFASSAFGSAVIYMGGK